MFEENSKNFRKRLTSRGYPMANNLVDKIIAEVKFEERKNALTQTQKARKRVLPFMTISSMITAMFEKHSNGKMASNAKPATTKRDIQGSSLDLL